MPNKLNKRALISEAAAPRGETPSTVVRPALEEYIAETASL